MAGKGVSLGPVLVDHLECRLPECLSLIVCFYWFRSVYILSTSFFSRQRVSCVSLSLIYLERTINVGVVRNVHVN